MIKSAPVRLTVWYMVILMSVSLLFSWALYTVAAQEVERDLQRPPSLNDAIEFGSFANFEAYRQERLTAIERGIKLNLLGFNLITLVIGGGASYWLARRTLQPIEAALEAQSRFTADASHELRTPLTSMKTEIEVALREHDLSAVTARALLASNLEEVLKLETLSNSLLRLAQYAGGQTKPQWETVAVNELVERAVRRTAKVAAARHIKLTVSGAANTVEGDAASLEELLVTLIDNGIKYGQPHTPVTIAVASERHQAVIRVTDQGIGIDPTDQPRIFDRFYRADTSRSKLHINGYGLGLAIAKQITELHHGHISVASRVGEGATFTINLPEKQPRRLTAAV